MQPKEKRNPRALLIKSAPAHKAQATSAGVMSLPEAIIRTLSLRPYSLRKSTSIGRDSLITIPTSSISDCGAAPVPPSPLSKVIKSGADSMPLCLISVNNSCNHSSVPITILNPTGKPLVSRILLSMSSNSVTDLISG